MTQPAIVVVAYNRPQSLRRLLDALRRAHYPAGSNVALVISVDGEHEVARASVDLATKLPWPHGEKRVLARGETLGLREHVLRCGDLTEEYGAIVVLEDDLYVSPHFYAFVPAALERYACDPKIAALSLYSFGYNECGETPFAALDDGNDVYFLQSASSWGQVWTRDRWSSFREWLRRRGSLGSSKLLPGEMNRWPSTSWKKLFNIYMAEELKYSVVPRHGLTTNLGDPGVHVRRQVTHFSTPMTWGAREWRLPALHESRCRYDPFFQIETECLREWSSIALPADLTLDFYAQRDLENVTTDWILTVREHAFAERRFGIRLFPFEMNVIEGIAGEDWALVRREAALPTARAGVMRRMRTFFAP